MSRRATALAILLVLLSAHSSQAVYHAALVDEVMSGKSGDPNVQFVEIRMLATFQNAVAMTRLTRFNCDFTSCQVLLQVPGNVSNQGAGVRWLMASPNDATFFAATGVHADFYWDPAVSGGIDPSCGMVCWGGGAPGIVPLDPASWNPGDPNQYVDCVAYGAYSGPTKTSTHDGTPTSGTPTPLTPGNGTQSLTRSTNTGSNAADFALAVPSPTNNGGPTGGAPGGPFGPCTPLTTATTTTVTTTTSTTTLGPNKCAGSKIKATGNKTACLLGLESKEAKTGDAPPADKVAKCKSKFSSAFAKAEGGTVICLTSGDTVAIETKVDNFVAHVDTELSVGIPSACQAAKLKATGKKAKCLLALEAKQAAKGVTPPLDKIDKCKAKFSTAFVKAESKPVPCNTSGDAVEIEGDVDAFVSDVDTELSQ
jgi:hypothetical protein